MQNQNLNNQQILLKTPNNFANHSSTMQNSSGLTSVNNNAEPIEIDNEENNQFAKDD